MFKWAPVGSLRNHDQWTAKNQEFYYAVLIATFSPTSFCLNYLRSAACYSAEIGDWRGGTRMEALLHKLCKLSLTAITSACNLSNLLRARPYPNAPVSRIQAHFS